MEVLMVVVESRRTSRSSSTGGSRTRRSSPRHRQHQRHPRPQPPLRQDHRLHMWLNGKDALPVERRIADLKSQGKEAFGKGDYPTAMYFYGLIMEIDPLDATMYANRSLCRLRMREGDKALEDARQCRMMQPSWPKAWYREGKALSFMKDYKGAADAFLKALQLDPKSDEINVALREAVKAMEELHV